MALRFRCPRCHQLLSIGTHRVGQTIRCPVCRRAQVVAAGYATETAPALRLRCSHSRLHGLARVKHWPLAMIGLGLVLLVIGGVSFHQHLAASPAAIDAAPCQDSIAEIVADQLPAVGVETAVLLPTDASVAEDRSERPRQDAGPVAAPSTPASGLSEAARDLPAGDVPLSESGSREAEAVAAADSEPPMVARNEPAGLALAPKSVPCRGDFGTALTFARNPAEAARLAKQNKKLAFFLHVSGNFEDAGFT